MTVQPLIIIGTGLAGYMLAKEWRKLDQTTPLTMMTTSCGGFYSKPLLSTALTQKKSAEQLILHNAQAMAKQLTATILTETAVTALDPQAHTVVVGDKRYPYQNCVLAVGARPRQLNVEGNARQHILNINHIADYQHFRQTITDKKHIVILGSGLIGCEFANDLTNGGYQVSVVSPDSTPLLRLLPPELGGVCAQSLAQQGVVWHLGCAPVRIDTTAGGYHVELNNGVSINADVVLSAIGLEAETTLAQSAGLAVNRGIVVDHFCRTSQSNIFALGDCAEIAGTVKQYVAPLLMCARTIAKTLAGDNTQVDFPCMPIIIKTPACPIVTCPPPRDVTGHWEITGTEPNLQALFYTDEGCLQGFSLLGDMTKNRQQWIKALS